MNHKFEHLFQPIEIGKLKLKNRICMAPMHTKYPSESGEVTEKLIEYFVERAKGGVGLIVVENTCVDWEYGKGDGNPVTIHDDRYRPRLHELVKSVHRYGAKIIPELHHVGRQTFSSNIGGRTPLSASAIQSQVGGDMPRAMTEEEIYNTINNFKNAARRAQEVGFDGVELHGAHGYLFNSFISPRTNIRNDKWGGTFENRCRFAVEVIRAVRKEVGPEFPMFFRMSAEESTENGLALEEGIKYAKVLEREGIDCLDVSHGSYESIKHFPMQGDPLDSLVYLAEAIKKEVNIPIIAVGSLGIDPHVAEDVIKEGKADMVHFGRELLAEPDLANKIKSGKFNEARKCIRCNECTGSIDKGHFLACAVNPECGYEYKRALKNKEQNKRIVVVGAGPGGMEYAITAAKMGCKVTILEKKDCIGGLASVCSKTDYKKSDIGRMMDYYDSMLKISGVDVHLGVEGTCEKIMEFSPDKVVLAMGSVPLQLRVPGWEKTKIAIEALMDNAEGLGKSVCIIGGSGVGLDLGLFMRERGIEATVVEMTDMVGRELSPMLRWHLKDMAVEKGVKILTSHKVVEITDKGVIAEKDGEQLEIECEDVLSAIGFERIDTSRLEEEILSYGVEPEVLGDMKGAGHFMEAIHAGFWHSINLETVI